MARHIPLIDTQLNFAWGWNSRRDGELRSTVSVVKLSSGLVGLSLGSLRTDPTKEKLGEHTAEHARISWTQLRAVHEMLGRFLDRSEDESAPITDFD